MTSLRAGMLRWAVRCIGFLIFGYLLYRIGPGKLWNTLAAVRPVYFALALPIFFVMIWVKTVKMRTLMRTDVALADLYRMNAFAFSIGSLTPGRLGEFSKIIFLSRMGIPISESFSVTFVDRLSDVGLMIVCALFGLYTFFGPVAGWLGLLVVILFSLGAFALWFSDRLLLRVTWGKWREIIEQEGASIRSYLRSLRGPTWAWTLAWTLVYLDFYFLQMWILALGLKLPVNYIQTTMAISCSAIPAILPISVANIGPRDAVLAAIFMRMGWGAEGGVALSTMILALFFMNGVFGLIFLPRKNAV